MQQCLKKFTNQTWYLQERSFFINLLAEKCANDVGHDQACITGVQVGSPDGDKFNIQADANGDVIVTDVTTSQTVTLPFYSDPFYIKDVTGNAATVVDMEDIRVVFYPEGHVRVDVETSAFFNTVR